MCRRCSECEHSSHHWIYNGGGELDQPDYHCKHCNAIGDTCRGCYGDGWEPEFVIDPIHGMAPEPCQECLGEGVILVGGGDVVYTKPSVQATDGSEV